MAKIDLLHGDCIEKMKEIPDNSIDCVITDPPYGTSVCKWDTVIPFESMWEQLKRITKDNGAICLFGSEPFSSHLRLSNIKMFKYDWVWIKNRPSNINCTNIRPMKYTEDIIIFSNGKKECYYPQMVERTESGKKRARGKLRTGALTTNHNSKKTIINPHKRMKDSPDKVLPKNTLFYPRVNKTIHPTQKPLPLLEYLIKTYTLEGKTVLDFTMGSGSTGVACKNLGRSFIGIERDEKYFNIAKKRIEGVANGDTE